MSEYADNAAKKPASQLAILEPAQRQIHPITKVLERYLTAIRGIGQTARIALPHIAKWKIAEIEKTQKILKSLSQIYPKKAMVQRHLH